MVKSNSSLYVRILTGKRETFFLTFVENVALFGPLQYLMLGRLSSIKGKVEWKPQTVVIPICNFILASVVILLQEKNVVCFILTLCFQVIKMKVLLHSGYNIFIILTSRTLFLFVNGHTIAMF